jgi:DNA-binding response OmpR family regulator
MAEILLVEDEKDMSDEIRMLLEKEGHEVDMASGYAEATRLFDARSHDLVILDIIMAIGDDEGIEPSKVADGRETGVAVFEYMRHAKPDQPVIIITVVRRERTLNKVRTANAILEKPFYPDEFLRTVRGVLSADADEETDE